jgi:hypothetical protein
MRVSVSRKWGEPLTWSLKISGRRYHALKVGALKITQPMFEMNGEKYQWNIHVLIVNYWFASMMQKYIDYMHQVNSISQSEILIKVKVFYCKNSVAGGIEQNNNLRTST